MTLANLNPSSIGTIRQHSIRNK